MANITDSLSDEEAIRAVKLFYDVSPKEIWQDKTKPPPERVRTLAADLQRKVPAESKPLVDSVLSAEADNLSTAARGHVCRMLLGWLEASSDLRPYVERAIEMTREPDMAIDPATGAFVIFLILTVFPRIDKGPDKLTVIPAWGLQQALKALPAVLKELPEGVKTMLGKKIIGG